MTIGSGNPFGINKATNDNKLSLMALHLECLFDRGVNFKTRTITLSDEIVFPMWDIVDAALSEMESQSRKKVTIRIHSEGGDVYEALAIVGRIERSPCKIITEGYGAIMSAATLILASGAERRISRLSEFMHHECSYGAEGRHSHVKDLVEQVEDEEDRWAKWMAEFSNRDKDFWKTEGVRKDARFTPEQLLEMGVVDEIF